MKMIVKYFEPGQIFTIFGHVWRVKKYAYDPCLACKQCELKKYWHRWNSVENPIENPCKLLCAFGKHPEPNQRILHYDCSAKMV